MPSALRMRVWMLTPMASASALSISASLSRRRRPTTLVRWRDSLRPLSLVLPTGGPSRDRAETLLSLVYFLMTLMSLEDRGYTHLVARFTVATVRHYIH
jgi:hypothetical protein